MRRWSRQKLLHRVLHGRQSSFHPRQLLVHSLLQRRDPLFRRRYRFLHWIMNFWFTANERMGVHMLKSLLDFRRGDFLGITGVAEEVVV